MAALLKLYLFPLLVAFILTFCARATPVLISPLTPNSLDGRSDMSMISPHAFKAAYNRLASRDSHEVTNTPYGIIVPFPKFAIVLLALFIVVCVFSSAAIIVLLYSKRVRRLRGPSTRVLRDRMTQKNLSGRHGEKFKSEQADRVLDISRHACFPSVENGAEATTAMPSMEKTDADLKPSTPNALDSNIAGKLDSPRNSHRSASLPIASATDLLRRVFSRSAAVLRNFTSINPFKKHKLNTLPVAQPASHLSNDVAPLKPIDISPQVSDINSANNPQHNTSSTPFYSLEDALSPSTAVYSLADMIALTVPMASAVVVTPGSMEVLGESDITEEFSPSRYVPGVQLETIREESENFSSTNSELSRPVSFTIPSTSRKSLFTSRVDFDSHTPNRREMSPNPRPTVNHIKITSDQFTDTGLFAGQCPTSRIPTTWEELAIDPQNPSLSRIFPPTRTPRSSESASTLAVVSVLCSPDRLETRQSGAVVSPDVRLVVEDLQGDWNERNGVALEDADECEDALHAADAMAAVITSLAAMGMDPTDMGLMADDMISPSLSMSDMFMESPHLSIFGMLGSHYDLRHHRSLDIVEEEEVEHEIGIEANSPTESGVFPAEDPEEQADDGIGATANTQQHNISHMYYVGASDDISGGKYLAYDSTLSERFVDAREQQPKVLEERSRSNNTLRSTGRSSNSHTHSKSCGVKLDRLYPSPSSLAGLSPSKISKRFPNYSTTSPASTPSPHGARSLSPQYRFSPASLTKVQKSKRVSLSPTFTTSQDSSGSPPLRGCSPSPHKRPHSPTSPSTPRTSGSPRRSTSAINTRRPSSYKGSHLSSSPTPLAQRSKLAVVPELVRSSSILQEKSNSMEL